MPLTLERFIEILAIMALISAVGVFIGWKWGPLKGAAFLLAIWAAIIGAAVLREAGILVY